MTNESAVYSIENLNSKFSEQSVDRDVFQIGWSWWHIGAALGIAGGVLATAVGLLLSIITWLAGHEIAVSREGQFGTWLIIATFPLMMFGAHSLDKIDRINKARQNAYCKQFGLTNKSFRK